MSLYREKILEHYREPRNQGVVEDAELESRRVNDSCGDSLHFTAAEDNGKLEEIRFEADGCALSVASASLLSRELEGKEVESVLEMQEEDVFELMGLDREAVNPVRRKCILMGLNAVKEMIEDGKA